MISLFHSTTLQEGLLLRLRYSECLVAKPLDYIVRELLHYLKAMKLLIQYSFEKEKVPGLKHLIKVILLPPLLNLESA